MCASSVSIGSTSVKFALYRPQDMSAELWQAFASLRDARTLYDDPFFDPDFARLVGEVRGDARIGVAFQGDDVAGFWALHVRPGGWARPIGGAFSDWHGPVLVADTSLTASAFLAGLDLAGMTVFGLLPQGDGIPHGLRRAGANMSDLSMGWENYLQQQQAAWPKHFKKMRRLYRNVARDFTNYEFVWDDGCGQSYWRLLDMKREQFARTGLHDVLKPEWAQALLDRLCTYQGPRLRARLVTLYFDEHHAASELNLQSDTVMHGWLTAYNRELGNYSPGNMLLQEVLQRMAETGLQTYDAGPGLDHYKRHYSNYQLPIDAGTLRGAHESLAPSRLAGQAWRWGENVMPDRASTMMQRARRRMDQVSQSEFSLSGRVSGLVDAFLRRGV